MDAPDRSEAETGGLASRVRTRLTPHVPALAAGAIGLAWFLVHVGPAVLDPTHVAWLMSGDWAQHYLGWAFFRNAPLGLPLGANPFFPAPAGSTLGFTDSIPLAGVLLRPFAALLPDDFQYLGPWLGLGFGLQGFVGAKLVRLACTHPVAQVAGGALFALAPPLLHRVVDPNTGHSAFATHWLLLAFLWLALAPPPRGPRRRLGAALALLLFSTGVSPYHVVPGAALAAALVLRLWLVDRLLDGRRAAGAIAAVPAAAALGLAAFGYFTSGIETTAAGYGFFSADALALLNPMGWSRLWDGPTLGDGQYEGFGYLGLGPIVAALAAIASAIVRRREVAASRWPSALPALGAAVALFLLSLSTRITLGGVLVAEFEPVGPLVLFAATFRSSGRFVWAIHYLSVFAALATLAVAWRDRPRLVAGTFVAALAIQAADVRPPIPFDPGAARWSGPRSELWSAARGLYRHVVLYPPYLVAGGSPVAPQPRACGGVAWLPDAWVPAADVAYRLGATFNSAYAGRLDPVASGRGCRELRRSVARGRLDPETLYLVQPAYRSIFEAARATCGTVDGLLACVSGARRDPFSAALRDVGTP